MGTAVERLLRLDAMTDDLAAAVIAHWSQFVYGTFEAVERMTLTGRDYLEGEIVVVPADFTSSHGALPERAAQYCHPGTVAKMSADFQRLPAIELRRAASDGSGLLGLPGLEQLAQIGRPGAEQAAGGTDVDLGAPASKFASVGISQYPPPRFAAERRYPFKSEVGSRCTKTVGLGTDQPTRGKAGAGIRCSCQSRNDDEEQEQAAHSSTLERQWGRSTVSLKVLHGPLVFLRRCPGFEGAQVPAFAGSGIFLFGVQPILTSGQFSDHPDLLH
jgi:hypothetical protein